MQTCSEFVLCWKLNCPVGRSDEASWPDGHVECVREMGIVCRVLLCKSEGKRSLGRPRSRWDDGI
jgi:hypothetical protein